MTVVTATKVLNIARSQIGYREGRRNDNKFGQWYGLNNVSWCDEFIAWVGHQAGAADAIGRFCYTPAHAAWFQKHGRWGHTPRRGAIVFYDFPADSVHRIQHVGIVESVRSDGKIVAIEGNTGSGQAGSQSNGNGVYRRVRGRGLIVGFGYPDYVSESKINKLPARVATSGYPPVTVDGVWGSRTTRALQRWLHQPDDGQIGPHTRVALQRALHVKSDGTWGRVTRKALQKALHVKADGQWGPQTIRALQKKLNNDWR